MIGVQAWLAYQRRIRPLTAEQEKRIRWERHMQEIRAIWARWPVPLP